MDVGVATHMAHKEQRQIVIRHVLAIRVRFVVDGVPILFMLHQVRYKTLLSAVKNFQLLGYWMMV
jgi:hypothetical protein